MIGACANIWAKEDQFQYVWREMSGNVAVTATMQFLGQGIDHRQARGSCFARPWIPIRLTSTS